MGILLVSAVAAFSISSIGVAASPVSTADMRHTCIVRSYSEHAEKQIKARHLNKSDIQRVVTEECGRARYQPRQQNWLFDGVPAVVMTALGHVVTIYWNVPAFTTAKPFNSFAAIH